MTGAGTICIEDLCVGYDEFTLGPVTLSIEAGERVALVGPNGAGKTTTLRAVCGLVPDFAGRILVGGVGVRDLGAAVRTRVGVLPERLLGFGWMTVAEHLRFLAAFHPGWDHAYCAHLCRRLDVPMSTKLANLSKGTQVKVALVAAEAFRPPVLLLDEPTSGIDPLMRGEVLSLLRECAPPNSGRTVVFSSHILEDVEEVADRVILLRAGRLLDDVGMEQIRVEAGAASVSRAIYRRLIHV